MFNQIIEVPGLPSGQAATARLVDFTTRVQVETGQVMTEPAPTLTRYRYTTTSNATGWHIVMVALSGVFVGNWYVKLANADGLYIARDDPPDTADLADDLSEAISNIPELVWAYTVRILTTGSGEATTTQDGTILTLYRGDTISISFTGLGSLAGRTKLWFSGKQHTEMTDGEADFVVEEGLGLITINGASPESSDDALITVTDEDEGNLTVVIKPGASKLLQAFVEGRYDVQVAIDDEVNTTALGELNITGDVTRATS